MTTIEMIKVMEAYAEGKHIQVLTHGVWEPVELPEWDWKNNVYRVRPEDLCSI